MKVLGIETSCDETSAAIFNDGKLLSNVIATQEIHTKWGGVVPELASRAHQKNIIPVVNEALEKADCKLEELDGIAFTQGPGLLGALMVGVNYAKGLSLALNKPLIAVHHMQAHILAHFIEAPYPEFPFLCLTVSGGHTQIVLVRDFNNMEILGHTIDDAAGEAFDKAAKMLGLPYPGGPLVDKMAKDGDPNAFTFAKPRMQGFNYSFSGLKTSILYFLNDRVAKDSEFISKNISGLCASIQKTITDILLDKLVLAAKEYQIKSIALAGGVSANSYLRNAFTQLGKQNQWQTFIPAFEYCTDNAGMIAIAGYYKLKANKIASLSITPKARIPGLETEI
ncbi:MAG: tRNA (adenosine(37)-N6)-threonylcarbamoyltransferase complex transferase subunit TsaD [Bacteroidetes bacterium]|nr:tRNA (adenosine(37)-N6)-threonylcarbamoyltransferase complex transferase subunit TsaD [Bacteroidota bacterium]MBP7399512.1 tRNA (adenosine(37)-N6)-threonylcarbamoyltransferase complex transferase subunit TsaD [Chitinophagales bacterium]MBK7110734.1 tRNA (adenosine(37)-N6)-threonylcarbamoyltransferase complex transferase subunit TsaD [Bacteroidota bacterium]MBK8682194.1 tRNA (adenosine(37)-N6)-threonylcarbamoyltransferase complex transferase subunit TsaD [Bacteroidota bacterium]MBP8755268.1 t